MRMSTDDNGPPTPSDLPGGRRASERGFMWAQEAERMATKLAPLGYLKMASVLEGVAAQMRQWRSGEVDVVDRHAVQGTLLGAMAQAHRLLARQVHPGPIAGRLDALGTATARLRAEALRGLEGYDEAALDEQIELALELLKTRGER